MTYREEIKLLVVDIQKINQRAEYLRNFSIEEEKNQFNALRLRLSSGLTILNRIDHALDEARAAMEI